MRSGAASSSLSDEVSLTRRSLPRPPAAQTRCARRRSKLPGRARPRRAGRSPARGLPARARAPARPGRARSSSGRGWSGTPEGAPQRPHRRVLEARVNRTPVARSLPRRPDRGITRGSDGAPTVRRDHVLLDAVALCGGSGLIRFVISPPPNSKGGTSMSFTATRRALVALSLCALAWTGGAAASDEHGRGIDPNQGESLVEVHVPSKAAAVDLQLAAESFGVEFNDHYLRENRDGSVTVTVFGNEDDFARLDSTPRTMSVNIDPDTTPDTYIEHRQLVRIGDAGTTSPSAPTRIRIGSSTGESTEADVDVWLGGGLPPMHSGFLKHFTTRYMDPTEVYARFDALAAEFPNIAELIPLPYETNGYQRKAQATMAGTTPPGNTVTGGTAQSQAVVLTSRAWGHEGGNDITAEFRNPLNMNAPLTVTAVGNDIVVNLG